jgi:UDP-N-acetylglucosamine--N-acetylmuramyl-(pentapeptide) pyrophosphoryl-undecaprenol N-acetylglucosamine transferase
LDSAHNALGLDPDLHTLLVLGGSKGARSINQALLKLLPELLKEMQVVHISGELDWSEVEAVCTSLKDSLPCAERYKPFPYLHDEMGAALTAADLVVSRAGASCLGEYPLFGLPAILVPYPYAWRYQEVNAQYLSKKGAAEVVPDEEIATQLLSKVRELMTDDYRREQMSQAMRTLVYPNAAESIASHLAELAALNRERD